VTAPKLDILYVGTLPPHPGGSAVQNAQVLAGLARRGHGVRAIGQITPPELEQGDAYAARHPELDVVRLTLPFLDITPDTPKQNGYREAEGRLVEQLVSRLVSARKPDLIVLGRESFAWHLPRLGHLDGIPLVLIAHGTTTANLVDGTYPRESAAAMLERLRRVDRVITPAAHVARLLDDLGVARVDVIANAVDPSLFRPAPPDPALARELSLTPGDVVVLHPSNLKRLKRPLDLVESARLALPEEPRLVYVIVGDGPLLGETKDAAAAAGVAARFRFVPWVEHERVPAYVNLADVVAMPSESETQALVYLETMACARTLLASDVPGVREVARDGDTAVFFRRGDVRELATQTVLLARDPARREAIGRRAREHVQRHALERVAVKYERALVEAVRERART
jgi:glycosyltransferase involved in cell wall biosynthesis